MTEAPQHSDDPVWQQPAQQVAPTAAGLGPRALARLVDFVVLAVVNAVVVGVVIVGALFGKSGGMVMGSGASGIVAGAVGALLGAVINLGYFAALESGNRQTIGKKVLKLRVLDATGNGATVEQAIRRNIWVAFGIAGVVPIIGGVIGSLAQLVAVILIAVGINDAKNRGRGWHDQFAGGTVVVAETAR